ncbi:zinc ribbon domain-containing protein [Streptomyces sp. Q6]|uniref:Zinc ribbon domain-containing protein n=1 Tax=Streptomyces citrinus TaxID=3118173 RepID=A0ACD5ANI5_9ACTN
MAMSGFGVMAPKQAEEGFAYQRCRWCGTASFRRLLCPVCAASDLERQYSEGPGVVVQSRVVHRGTGTARNESLVRFPEGFVVPCRVVGTAPNLVWVGATVRSVLAGAEGSGDSGEVLFELRDTIEDDDDFRRHF